MKEISLKEQIGLVAENNVGGGAAADADDLWCGVGVIYRLGGLFRTFRNTVPGKSVRNVPVTWCS